MFDVDKEIAQADQTEIERLLTILCQRYGELYSDKELCIISVPKGADRNKQIDHIIAFLENMKHFSEKDL